VNELRYGVQVGGVKLLMRMKVMANTGDLYTQEGGTKHKYAKAVRSSNDQEKRSGKRGERITGKS